MATKVIEDKSYWLQHISDYKSSGVSNKSAYCLQAGVTYHRFLYWFEKLSRELVDKNTPRKPEQLIPVQVAAKPQTRATTPLCILEFKQGHRLLVHNESVLEKLIILLSR